MLQDKPWYGGSMDRKAAEEALRDTPGMYPLLSYTNWEQMVLSLSVRVRPTKAFLSPSSSGAYINIFVFGFLTY